MPRPVRKLCARRSSRAHLQDELASHAAPLEPLVRRGGSLERERFLDGHLQLSRRYGFSKLIQPVAVRLDQRFLHTDSATFRLSPDGSIGAVAHREEHSSFPKRRDQRLGVLTAHQVEGHVSVAGLQRFAITPPGRCDDMGAAELRDLNGQVAHPPPPPPPTPPPRPPSP